MNSKRAIEAGTTSSLGISDLSRPNAEAEGLADTLRTVQTNMIFTRVVTILLKWIIRPLVIWPIKYGALALLAYFKLLWKIAALTFGWYARAPRQSSEQEWWDRYRREKYFKSK